VKTLEPRYPAKLKRFCLTLILEKFLYQLIGTKSSNNGYTIEDVNESGALDLAATVAQSVQIWYNVSGNMPQCINWKSQESNLQTKRKTVSKKLLDSKNQNIGIKDENNGVCTASKEAMDSMTAWNILTCNEGLNLVNWWAQGVGHDLYWPPNQEKDYSRENLVPGSLSYCVYLQNLGLYGIPSVRDDWSFWLDTVYGGTRMQYASNIVYSNGNLDPWMPAGVAQTENSNDGSVVSLIIEMGGHHLDLFFPTEEDPESVRTVRAIEDQHIAKWISDVAKRNKQL